MMNDSRKRNAKLNMATGLIQEIIALICGLILPRVTLVYFGSTYNGLVNSVVQFLSFSTVLRSGLGAVTHAALYKPLAENNEDEISGIMVATSNFMKKVSYLLVGLILVFATFYPLAVQDEFNYLFSFSLVIIIGLSTLLENLFSVKYKILLQADQKYYIQTIASIGTQVLSTVVSVLIILAGGNIHFVRLAGALAFTTTPLFLNFYVKKHYSINWKAKANNIALKQRWDAFALQLATIVNSNVDIVILTLMLSMREVSVYSVYYMVVNNITKLVSGSINGIKAVFGDMLVRNEISLLQRRFKEVECGIFAGATIMFSITAILITSFVMIYTRGITDVNYNRYYFGLFMSCVHMLNVVRLPYQLVVEAAGHFKQTRNGAILEVIFNIMFSVVFIYLFGVIGILMGTIIASLIRTVQFVVYACNNILKISLIQSFRNFIIYFGTFCSLVFVSRLFVPDYMGGYAEWICYAVFVTLITCIVVLAVSFLLNGKQTISICRHFMIRK